MQGIFIQATGTDKGLYLVKTSCFQLTHSWAQVIVDCIEVTLFKCVFLNQRFADSS